MYPKWRGLCGILTLSLSLAVLGCGSSGNSNIRAVNASPGFSPFTYQIGQTGFASALPYGTEGVQPKGDNYGTNDTSGNYRIVGPAANQTLSTYVTQGTTLTSQKVTLLKNGYYTAVSYGTAPTMALALLVDNDSAPPSGQYKLRFVNYSGYSAVDVYIVPAGAIPSGNPTFGNVGFNNPTYLPLSPGTLSILITPTGDPSTVLSAAAFSPAAGSIYSVFFVSPNPSQPPPNAGPTGYGMAIVNDPVSPTATTSSSSGS